MKFRYYITPGHGYLYVPMDVIHVIGFTPTPYSYMAQSETAMYLEEDCDMPAFLWLYNQDKGHDAEIEYDYIDSDIPKGRPVPAQSYPSTYEQWREAMEV